jgi:hypothetical protein
VINNTRYSMYTSQGGSVVNRVIGWKAVTKKMNVWNDEQYTGRPGRKSLKGKVSNQYTSLKPPLSRNENSIRLEYILNRIKM